MSLYDELTTGPLAAEMAPHIAAGDDGAIYAALHRKDISTSGKISSHDIRQYLMLQDLLLSIESSSALTCVATARALDIFPVFDLSIPEVLTKFTAILDGLVNEPLIPAFTLQHKADLLSLGVTQISRAEQLGISPTIQDIASALRG